MAICILFWPNCPESPGQSLVCQAGASNKSHSFFTMIGR